MVFGQCFALLGAEIFNDTPKYYRGKGLSLGAAVVGAIGTMIFLLYLRYLNDCKLRNQDSDEAIQQRSQGVEDLCDAHPDFFYWY